MQDERNGHHRNSLLHPWKPITKTEITKRWNQRREIYQQSCDFTVKNNKNIHTVTSEIIPKINTWNICLPIIQFDTLHIEKLFNEIKNIPSIKYVEIRIDFLESINQIDPINEVIKKCPKKVILTNRYLMEWWDFMWSFRQSVEILSQIQNPNYIDTEVEAWKNIETLKQHTKTQNIGLITSYHNFERTENIDELKEKLEQMWSYDPDIYKIAMMPKKKKDVKTIYELTQYFKQNYPWKDFIFISMGKKGKNSRINIPKMWGFITFATQNESTTAPGQIHYKKLQNKLYSQSFWDTLKKHEKKKNI